ncbi:hypothetical protein XM47_14095 [Catenovulum maritimum]|uniref:Uncharacterized protein n=2 Tax=Catenovulum maritimum TaxID=1513271 RepID=A0A0J8GNM4_9ALTE|nr:hypothetical protein XM47_14095 [Catenovulum maritimum]
MNKRQGKSSDNFFVILVICPDGSVFRMPNAAKWYMTKDKKLNRFFSLKREQASRLQNTKCG